MTARYEGRTCPPGHTGHDTEHLGLSATKGNTARGRKTSLAHAPAGLPLSTSSAATRKFCLPPLLPLPLWKRGCVIQESLRPPPPRLRNLCLLLLLLLLPLPRPELELQEPALSMPSPPASNGTKRRGTPASEHRGAADNPCGSATSSRGAGRNPELAVFCTRRASCVTSDLASRL